MTPAQAAAKNAIESLNDLGLTLSSVKRGFIHREDAIKRIEMELAEMTPQIESVLYFLREQK